MSVIRIPPGGLQLDFNDQMAKDAAKISGDGEVVGIYASGNRAVWAVNNSNDACITIRNDGTGPAILVAGHDSPGPVSVFEGDVDVLGSLNVTRDLNLDHNLILKGDANVSNNLNVTNDLNLGHNLNLSGILNVAIGGDIILASADVAEDFSIADYDSVSPGCVMIFDEDGALKACNKEYDKKAVGVVSGAGNFKPGLILDRTEKSKTRMPIALMGKVFCMVDADISSIEVGDLLTTSCTKGHAMKAQDASKAFGTVIGKALKPLKEGKGLVPILVTLQ